MNYPKLKLFLIFCLTSPILQSQKEASQWHFAYKVGMNFLNNPPTFVASSCTANLGSSSISDTAGNLLLYSNGLTVWNQTHAAMANGTGLLGSSNMQSECL